MIYIFDKAVWKDGKEAVIKTEIGEVALRLENKSSFLRKRIIIYDRYHVEIGLIENRLFKTGFNYVISYDNQKIATVFLKRSIFSKKYMIRTSDKDLFKIKGKVKEFKYQIFKGKKAVAKVDAEFAHRPNQYGMKTDDEKRFRYTFLCAAVIFSL